MRSFTIFFTIISLSTFSQTPSFDRYYKKQHRIERRSMVALVSWGGVNLITGLVGLNVTSGETKYFHQMNASWGAINTGIGLTSLLISKKHPETKQAILNNSHRTEKILYLNSGLDVAYITTGLFLKEYSKNNPENEDRFQGFGNSLLFQGGFLLLFDLTQLIIHSKHRSSNEQSLWSNLSLSDSGIGLKYTIHYR